MRELGRTNYVQFGISVLTDVNLKLIEVSKTHKQNQQIAEQNNYQKALPNQAYIDAHQSFMEGKGINKAYIEQRVAAYQMNNSGAIITATTNHGRDGPN